MKRFSIIIFPFFYAKISRNEEIFSKTSGKFQKRRNTENLFSDKKMFDIDGVYNAQNDRVWAVDRGEADKNIEKKQKRKFPQKVMV